ncbi:hypothetical protein SAMN05421747_10425 [Parapedobacter composti]|uniref:Uncharacterized protein n=1 Tax=Parapedobacter composti TaxID=623281 RepID=A0A1I1G8K4_9SPHI|nr:hypothetical protein SAMN05421747_10425 [Parapedobacter composti]
MSGFVRFKLPFRVLYLAYFEAAFGDLVYIPVCEVFVSDLFSGVFAITSANSCLCCIQINKIFLTKSFLLIGYLKNLRL